MVAHDAFTQALTNPLLAENVFNEDTFSAEGMKIIKATNTPAQVVARNTGIKDSRDIGFKVQPSLQTEPGQVLASFSQGSN
jgi:prostaglandin-endoperoxide synthase 2